MQVDDNIIRVPLRARDGSVRAYALVDATDAEWVNQWRWYFDGKYVSRSTKRNGGAQKKIRLHRILLGMIDGDGLEGDHINRNRMDNRRDNLRILTRNGNRQNVPGRLGASRHRGVYWKAQNNRWCAQVRVGGKCHHIGYFVTEDEAAIAVCAARKRLMPFATD